MSTSFLSGSLEPDCSISVLGPLPAKDRTQPHDLGHITQPGQPPIRSSVKWERSVYVTSSSLLFTLPSCAVHNLPTFPYQKIMAFVFAPFHTPRGVVCERLKNSCPKTSLAKLSCNLQVKGCKWWRTLYFVKTHCATCQDVEKAPEAEFSQRERNILKQNWFKVL